MTTPSLHQLSSSLTASGLPTPSAAFLQPLLSAQPTRPLAALIATAKHRLLSSNLVTSNPAPLDASKHHALPANLADVKKKEVVLPQEVCVQVLDIEDLSRSRWEQIESLESERKGEMTKGREVIRVIQDVDAPATQASNSPNSTSTPANNKSHGPFKLLLQDMRGQKVYGFEFKSVQMISTSGARMSIGCKIRLRRGTRVARGMVLLEPQFTTVLGGKIESLDKAWREGREARLREEVGDVGGAGRRAAG